MPSATPSVSPSLWRQILDSPAEIAPAGQTSDVNAQNPFHAASVVLFAVFASVSGAAILVRLLTECFLVQGLAVEDYTITVAWVLYTTAFVWAMKSTREGAGKHMWDVSIGDSIDIFKAVNYESIFYGLSIGLIKLAILLQYLRIFTFGKVNKPLRIACWVWIVINSIFYTLDTFLQAMQCLPRERIWNILYPGGHCLSLRAIWVGTGIFNTISDTAILLLPLPAIARLQMSRRRRLTILAIFATGSLACAASAVRTYYTWRFVTGLDKTYWIKFVGIWIWIEMFIGILVFCLPTTPRSYFFVKSKSRNLYNALSGHSTSVFGSSMKKRSDSSLENAVREQLNSAPLPYVDVSLASFEQRPVEHGDGDIHVLRSVLQVVEKTDGVDPNHVDSTY